jgi:Tfp pilus assembly protein PilP
MDLQQPGIELHRTDEHLTVKAKVERLKNDQTEKAERYGNDRKQRPASIPSHIAERDMTEQKECLHPDSIPLREK